MPVLATSPLMADTAAEPICVPTGPDHAAFSTRPKTTMLTAVAIFGGIAATVLTAVGVTSAHRRPFGVRRYDRSYFSTAYRYRSDLPTFGADRTSRPPVRQTAERNQRAYQRSHVQPGSASAYGRRR